MEPFLQGKHRQFTPVLGKSRGIVVSHYVEDNIVVSGIVLMTMLRPFPRPYMDLDIPNPKDFPDPDTGIEKIRSGVLVRLTDPNKAKWHSVRRPQIGRIE